MEFTVLTLTRCEGQNHFKITGTIDGQVASLEFDRADLAIEPEGRREAVIARLRSAIKEAGATTFSQAKAAIETKTYKV